MYVRENELGREAEEKDGLLEKVAGNSVLRYFEVVLNHAYDGWRNNHEKKYASCRKVELLGEVDHKGGK